MAICGRRNRSKLIFCVLGAFVAGYLIFPKDTQSDSGPASRRELPAEENRNVDAFHKRPVYEKPPLDVNALGEMGRAVKFTDLSDEEKRKEEESIRKHQINTYVSDKVSLHRRLPERWNPL